MHTLTLVLLPRDVDDLRAACTRLLEPHRLDWDDTDRPSRFDYWTMGPGRIAEAASAMELGVAEDEGLAGNVCPVARLPADYHPGAVVTPDGAWHDLADHGWRLLDGDSAGNRAALAAWTARVRELLARHQSCVGVEVDAHS